MQCCDSVVEEHLSFSVFSPLGLPWQNSQCVSGPDSMTHDFIRVSVRDRGGSLPPAYMSSVQCGYEELGPEQQERLQQDINSIKNNYRKFNVSDNNGQGNIKRLLHSDYSVSVFCLRVCLVLQSEELRNNQFYSYNSILLCSLLV